jgi:hypothetical protein
MEKRVLNVYDRFRNLQKLKKPLYISAFTMIISCKEAMEAQENKRPTPVQYLECLLNIRDNFRKIKQIKDEGFVYALSAVMSMVSIEIIAKLHDIIYEYIHDVLENTSNTLVIKYCVVVIQFLLESKTQEQWRNDENTQKQFIRLFNFCLHTKDNVKRQGIRSFMIICQHKDLSYFSKVLTELDICIFKVIDQADLNKPR